VAVQTGGWIAALWVAGVRGTLVSSAFMPFGCLRQNCSQEVLATRPWRSKIFVGMHMIGKWAGR
jgi:hypothetical protein